ncbi:MAG TPA: septation protein IspZ, partial [Burkholderiales bacterium]|nr:septation protein IspZ [Burkholderiales bacterium]
IGKNMIKLTFNKEVDLSERIWNRLNIAWGLYFIFLGILNLFIAFNFSEYMWVKFKVFGSLTLTFIFTLICIAVVSIYRKKA